MEVKHPAIELAERLRYHRDYELDIIGTEFDEPIEAQLRRIPELEEEIRTWKEYAAECGRQLAALRKEKAPKAATPEPPGFTAFWAAWPAGPRKVNKKACLTRWHAAKLEANAAHIVEHVEACKAGRDWCKDGGAFVPAPLVYLNQERYLAPIPKPERQVGSLAGMNYKSAGIDADGHFN